MIDQPSVARLHYELIRPLIDTGICPTNAELASRLNLPLATIEDQLRALAAIHGVVLHPHTPTPWIIHPFSLTPTLHWIEAPGRSWWAPCIWCAFGVATLAGGEVRLHSRYEGEGESLVIPVRNGQPVGFESLVVHFAIAPAHAWDNVHEHCSMVLPFRHPDQIAPWSSRHALPRGAVVPLRQVADLAARWYGSHADSNWQKWTIAQAQAIFRDAGLVAPFWSLENKDGRF